MTAHLLLKCVDSKPCSVVLEPYGVEHLLAADDHLRLELESGEVEVIEIAYSPGCLTVWLPATIARIRATDRLGNDLDLGLAL